MHDDHRSGASPLLVGLRLLRERWLVLAALGLLGLALALAWSLTRPTRYDATATVVLVDDAGEALINEQGASSNVDPQRRAQTELALLQSPRIASQVVQALGLRTSPDELAAEVDVTLDAESDVIDITVTDADPRRAADVANQWASQYELSREESRRTQYQQLIPVLRRQIAQGGGAQAVAALRSRLRDVEQAAAYTQAGVDLYSRAQPSDTPASPQPKRDAALGLLLGLGAGLALVLVVDVLDRRIKRTEDFEAAYGVRALGTLQQRPRRAGFGATDLEALRILRGNLGHLSLPGDIRTVIVTSAVAEEGKTSVAAGLARVAAGGGEDVLLIEADLRRPAAARALDGVSDRAGLSEILGGRTTLEEVVEAPMPDAPRLHLLAGGSPPANPADLLRSRGLGALLEEAGERYDLVVVDLPPLLPVADAQLLLDLPQVDAALVVARVDRTTHAEVRRAGAILEGHRQSHLGLVVNGARRGDAAVSYGYGPERRGAAGLLSRRSGGGSLPEGPIVADAEPDRG